MTKKTTVYHPTFDAQDVKVEKKEVLFQGFFKLIRYTFRHRLFAGGWSPLIQREMFDRGSASGVLAYDPNRDEVVLIEQVRVGPLEISSPWQLEIIAGMNDEGESPESVAIREAKEEAGIEVQELAPITHYYSSSGGSSETLTLFAGKVDATQATGLHGLLEEDEDIQVHVMSREDAYQLVENGVIENAATIIALQWLQLHYQTLQKRWESS